MIIWDGGFFTELQDNYSVVISGRLGSGKTLIAHEIAEFFLKRGYKMVTNIQNVWNEEDWNTITMNDRVIGLLDEGGMYVRTAKTVQTLAAFLRKTKSIIIFSGKKQPHEDLCDLRIYLWFDAWRNLLLPFKIWRWEMKISNAKRYNGYLFQTGWQAYYGVYSTTDPGDFPEKVVRFFEDRAKKVFAKYGREYKIQDVVSGDVTGGEAQQVEFARDMADVAETFNESLSVSPGPSRRGRWRR